MTCKKCGGTIIQGSAVFLPYCIKCGAVYRPEKKRGILAAVTLVVVVVAALSSGCVVSVNGTAYDCVRDDASFTPTFTCAAITDDNPLVIGTGPINRSHAR